MCLQNYREVSLFCNFELFRFRHKNTVLGSGKYHALA